MGPGRLLQLEGAELPDAAAPGIGETARIDELCLEPRRIEAAERGLRMGPIGQAHGGDAPIAPGLPQQPGATVETVGALAQIFGEAPLGAVASAAILIGDPIALLREIGGEPGARGGLGRSGRHLAAARNVAPVGRALEDDGEGPCALRQMDIGASRAPSRISTIAVTSRNLASHARFFLLPLAGEGGRTKFGRMRGARAAAAPCGGATRSALPRHTHPHFVTTPSPARLQCKHLVDVSVLFCVPIPPLLRMGEIRVPLGRHPTQM